MKHIKLFEEFISDDSETLNEGLDPAVAKAVLKVIANREFQPVVYLSLNDRDQVKNAAGGKRLTGVPGPENGVRFTTLLNALGKGEFYTDNTDLVKGDKTVVDTKTLKTFGDLKKFVGGF